MTENTLKKVPRYRAIADGLIDAIVGKRYPVGSSLPAETELCEQLQASRHTIREALRILEEGGLISRRQGSGSEVIAETPPVRYRQNVDSIEDLMQYGNATRVQVLRSREVPIEAAIAAMLHIDEGTRCIELVGLRSERNEDPRPGRPGRPGRPFALSTVYFPPQPPRRRDKLLKVETALPIMLDALDARALGRIEQSFEAVALDAESARHLQQKKGAPSIRAQRVYFDRQGTLVLAAITLHRADLFRYSTVLRHESG